MLPKNNKHAPTKGQERPLPAACIGKIPIAIPIAPNGFLGTWENHNALHAVKSNTGRSAVQDADSKPDEMISTDRTPQDDATR
jgi:hypothetical protein